MRYRCLKVLERPDWNPPQTVLLYLSYEAEPVEVDGEDVMGGVSDVWWMVTNVIIGKQDRYLDFHEAAARSLDSEADLNAELRDHCQQDYAERTREENPETGLDPISPPAV